MSDMAKAERARRHLELTALSLLSHIYTLTQGISLLKVTFPQVLGAEQGTAFKQLKNARKQVLAVHAVLKNGGEQ